MQPSHLAPFGTPLSEAINLQTGAVKTNGTISTFIQIALIGGFLYIIYRLIKNAEEQSETNNFVNEINSVE